MSDDAVVRRSVALAMKEGWHHALTPADLYQEGWLAVLEADHRRRAPVAGHHRAAYLAMRTLGAMRDARQKMMRQARNDVAAGAEAEWVDDGEYLVDRAHVQAQLRRFLGRREPTPAMRDVLVGLVAGEQVGQIAARRGSTVSAVYKAAERVDWLMAMLR
jgi:hypothetical protein